MQSFFENMSAASYRSVTSTVQTAGFTSSTDVAIKAFQLLRSTSASNYPFCYMQLTLDSSKKSKSIFQYGFSSIFKASFRHNY